MSKKLGLKEEMAHRWHQIVSATLDFTNDILTAAGKKKLIELPDKVLCPIGASINGQVNATYLELPASNNTAKTIMLRLPPTLRNRTKLWGDDVLHIDLPKIVARFVHLYDFEVGWKKLSGTITAEHLGLEQ